MSDYRIVYSDDLCHYGIPGMRWGHKKVKPISVERARLQSAKAAYKTANRAYSKAHAQARNYDTNPIVRSARSNGFTNELRKKASDRKWDDALKKGKEAYKAEQNYKQAKKEYKQTDEYKAKRAKAIKVGAAVAGTALAAYGAYKVSKITKQKYSEQLAEKIIREYGHESISNYNMFVKDTASRVKTKEAVVGLAKFSNEKKRIAKYKERLAKEAVERAQNDAQMEYIKRMIGNQKSNRAYY